MILVDETSSETGGGPGPAPTILEERLEIDTAWRRDVALEMWIDVTTDPVAIRLAGVLDESTGANLLSVVEDCVAEGRLDFELDTNALRVDGSGRRVIEAIRAQVLRCGGRLRGDRGVAS